MLYKRPPGMRYVDFAIYIDEHIRDEDKDEQKLFEYMWHLFYILAVKGRYFTTTRDYDEYALYGATQLYMRYQKEGTERGKNLKPIKSCLNYIKKVLYPMKVNYQQQYFEQVLKKEMSQDEYVEQLQSDKEEMVRKSSSDLVRVEYTQYIRSMCATIKYVLKSSPYQKDKATMHNIYLSCLLTLLKTVTMSNKNKARFNKRVDRALSVENIIDQIYMQESQDNVVLYHIDSSMKNYIMTLVAYIRKEIVKDLRGIIGSFEPSEQVIKDVLMSPAGGSKTS